MIYLNIGSNLPSIRGGRGRKDNIENAVKLLKKLKFNLLEMSSFYETPSYPNKNDPRFINLCIKLESNLSAIDFLKKIKEIETKLGRTRLKKNEPRTCDIDIIDYNKKYQKGIISLPHPRMHKRSFVLLPLFEVNKDWIHPITKRHIKTLILSLPNRDISSIKQI